MKNNIKIDTLFFVLVGILVILSAMLIFTFRGIFNAFSVAGNFVNTDASSDLKIDEAKLEEATEFTFGEKSIVPLSIKDNALPPTITITPKPTP
jgi:hypothetical protein